MLKRRARLVSLAALVSRRISRSNGDVGSGISAGDLGDSGVAWVVSFTLFVSDAS